MTKPPKSSNALKKKPFTPIRRFFFKLELLGKRQIDQFQNYSNSDSTATGSSQNQSQHRGKENDDPQKLTSDIPHLPYRIALQNEDAAEDVVIITALDNIPFCCHEDLITMSREKLITVALSLNAKLPSVLAIDVSHNRPTSFIRSSIELIVGLRGDVPRAPKAVKLRSEKDIDLSGDFDMNADMNKSPPTSPLAKRNRLYDPYMSLGSPRLERLEEELEADPEREAGRPAKKRKTSGGKVDSDVDMDLGSTPTQCPPLLRVNSLFLAPTAMPTPPRVLRSHSQKIEKKVVVDRAFINKKPAYRYRSKVKEARTQALGSSSPIGAKVLPRKSRSLRPISGYRPFLPPADNPASTSDISANSSSSQMSVEDSPESPNSLVGRKRKRSPGQTEDERQMASGIGEMNIRKSTSDMDIAA